jgi:hypothetical protein
MGANLTMIDWQHGHLARDGRAHAINLLDALTSPGAVEVRAVNAAWTSEASPAVQIENERAFPATSCGMGAGCVVVLAVNERELCCTRRLRGG